MESLHLLPSKWGALPVTRYINKDPDFIDRSDERRNHGYEK